MWPLIGRSGGSPTLLQSQAALIGFSCRLLQFSSLLVFLDKEMKVGEGSFGWTGLVEVGEGIPV